LQSESKETLDLYGCDPDKPSFARACLLARRMVERGVRFINIYHEGRGRAQRRRRQREEQLPEDRTKRAPRSSSI
jgi:hypothetical protein